MAKPNDGLIPYSVDNTFHACYIRAIGGKGLILDRTNPKSINFCFTLTPDQVKLADSYNTGGIPMAIENAHKVIMRLIKSGATQPEDE